MADTGVKGKAEFGKRDQDGVLYSNTHKLFSLFAFGCLTFQHDRVQPSSTMNRIFGFEIF